ncbi:MAG: hypothetical protein ACRDJM_04545, partial [Actinomycetota bacterium]
MRGLETLAPHKVVSRSQQDPLQAPLRVVIAATRALLHPSAGLHGPVRDLAESAGRNAEMLGRLLVRDETPSRPARGIVDVT